MLLPVIVPMVEGQVCVPLMPNGWPYHSAVPEYDQRCTRSEQPARIQLEGPAKHEPLEKEQTIEVNLIGYSLELKLLVH